MARILVRPFIAGASAIGAATLLLAFTQRQRAEASAPTGRGALVHGTTAKAASPESGIPHVVPDPAVARHEAPANLEPHLSRAALLRMARRRIKHVFVIYQENRAFDSYFGTFPGADGLFSRPASATPGFYQTLLSTTGQTIRIHPFRLGAAQYAADLDDVDHSHPSIVRKIDIEHGAARMDRFAMTEEEGRDNGGTPSPQAVSGGELTMAYVDGDTIPFLWTYANRFVLFDHIFQQMTGPSTPGNLCIIAAQTGLTQWIFHPDEAYGKLGAGRGVPLLSDPEPFWGSRLDTTTKGRMPFNPASIHANPENNLTFASLPLTLAGARLGDMTKHDRRPDTDLRDLRRDVAAITNHGGRTVPWGWYQEGFDREPTDPGPLDAEGHHASYVTHHNGPQYFGYIADNPAMNGSMHGLNDLFRALRRHTLPPSGVFYVKGGYQNILGLRPSDPAAAVQKNFKGDDDHPGYSDARISEAHVAEIINHIARSRYWKDCAIIITWDDSDGSYDHVPPIVRAYGPDGSPISDGPRVPLLFISPYGRSHAVVHSIGDHASVVKFVDAIFNLPTLASLPNEARGIRIGRSRGLPNTGPLDGDPGLTDLIGALDPARLTGRAKPLPAAYARIPESRIRNHPQDLNYGWRAIGVLPEDYRLGIVNRIPAGFTPRPDTGH